MNKAFTIAKKKAYERLYQKLETHIGEKDVFRLAMVWEKKTRDLGNVRCIKGENGHVLAVETKIRERWQSSFSMLFNGKRGEYSQCLDRGVPEGHQYDKVCSRISKVEVKDALRKMKSRKDIGPDLIPVEI